MKIFIDSDRSGGFFGYLKKCRVLPAVVCALMVLCLGTQMVWAEPSDESSQEQTVQESGSETVDTEDPDADALEDEEGNEDAADAKDAADEKDAADVARDAQGRVLTEQDLGFWFRGIDEEAYANRLKEATSTTPTTGVGYCASWVSYVYQAAGLGFVGGNACDMWQFCCTSTDADAIHEGMIIAVRYSQSSRLGMIYGHCGILLRNPDYKGGNASPESLELQKEQEELYVQLTDARTSGDRKELSALMQRLNEVEDELSQIGESDEGGQYFEVKDRMIQTDLDGNEKWLVADSTTSVGVSPLSRWISTYDYANTAAWGWGHAFSGRVAVWEGDIPSLVPFVAHEANEGLKEVYGIDFDNLSDGDAYWAVCSACASSEGQPGAITIEGGAVVDNGRYYELLGHMTPEQGMRWESILTVFRQQDEAMRLAEEEEARRAFEEEQRLEEERAAREAAEQQAAQDLQQDVSQPETSAQVTPEQSVPVPETSPAVVPEPQIQAETQLVPEPQVETQPAMQPQTESQPVAQPQVETQSATQPQPVPEETAGAGTEQQGGGEVPQTVEPVPEPAPVVEPVPEPEPMVEAQPVEEAQPPVPETAGE